MTNSYNEYDNNNSNKNECLTLFARLEDRLLFVNKKFFPFLGDLIDMQSKLDPPYKYICHAVDHFLKFHCRFPLINKCAEEVSKDLVEEVYYSAYYIWLTNNFS